MKLKVKYKTENIESWGTSAVAPDSMIVMFYNNTSQQSLPLGLGICFIYIFLKINQGIFLKTHAANLHLLVMYIIRFFLLIAFII